MFDFGCRLTFREDIHKDGVVDAAFVRNVLLQKNVFHSMFQQICKNKSTESKHITC